MNPKTQNPQLKVILFGKHPWIRHLKSEIRVQHTWIMLRGLESAAPVPASSSSYSNFTGSTTGTCLGNLTIRGPISFFCNSSSMPTSVDPPMVLAKLLLYSQSEAEEAKPGTKQELRPCFGRLERWIERYMDGWVDGWMITVWMDEPVGLMCRWMHAINNQHRNNKDIKKPSNGY